MNVIIKNKPAEADNYEFVVAKPVNDNEFLFYNMYTNGFKAEQDATKINGVIFHNVRIQGKRQ